MLNNIILNIKVVVFKNTTTKNIYLNQRGWPRDSWGPEPIRSPQVQFALATRTRVKSQEYVECRGPRGNSRLTTVAGNPRLPKKKKKGGMDIYVLLPPQPLSLWQLKKTAATGRPRLLFSANARVLKRWRHSGA